MTRTPAARASERRRRAKPAGRASEARRRRAQTDRRPFVGCDGEGSGTDDLGRQHYMLFRMGDRELFTGQPLTTAECLDHICDAPHGPIYVGFAFGYDVTMILRDLPAERRARLFEDKEDANGATRRTYWRNWAIEYLPRNYLTVARLYRVRTPDGRLVPRTVPGSSRTIYETFGFFQKSFLASLKMFGVGRDHWETIERNKAERAGFDATTPEVRRYCAIECDLLADMMQAFRQCCLDAGIRPRTWNGAGKLSKALHAANETPRAHLLSALIDDDVTRTASLAYYGGRFEVSRIGLMPGPVYAYDINSAYPDAMRNLPCLLHGRWERLTAAQMQRALAESDDITVGTVRFRHRSEGRQHLCGLPVRQKTGRLCWPVEGVGTYWSEEIRSARDLGCHAVYQGPGWRFVRTCDCDPFRWVPALYAYRKSLGKDLAGYPIKVGINGLYGTLAQRIGAGPYKCMIWAGLITARTRAKLNRAVAMDRDAVCMLATDAVFATRPLALPLSGDLGAWEQSDHKSLFIAQPGIYWGPPDHAAVRKMKSRGAPIAFFADKTDRFETAWRHYAEADNAALAPGWGTPTRPPRVPVEITLFVGLRLAQARGKPDTAGCWVRQERQINMDWSGKRGRHVWETPLCALTHPLAGGPDFVSRPHDGDRELIESMDMDRAELDEQPDHVDLGPVFVPN